MAVPARKIRSEEEDLAALALEGIPAAVMILEATGRVVFASSQAGRILGGDVESVAEAIGPSVDFPREEAFTLLRGACESGAAVSRLLTLDQERRRYFQVSASPLPGGGAGGQMAVLIMELTALLGQGDIARDFVRQVRHDLRGPLTSMRGAVDLLLTGRLGPLEEKQTKVLGLVEKATRQMTAIVSGSPDPAAGGTGDPTGRAGG